jgi:hypothetical protein
MESFQGGIRGADLFRDCVKLTRGNSEFGAPKMNLIGAKTERLSLDQWAGIHGALFARKSFAGCRISFPHAGGPSIAFRVLKQLRAVIEGALTRVTLILQFLRARSSAPTAARRPTPRRKKAKTSERINGSSYQRAPITTVRDGAFSGGCARFQKRNPAPVHARMARIRRRMKTQRRACRFARSSASLISCTKTI